MSASLLQLLLKFTRFLYTVFWSLMGVAECLLDTHCLHISQMRDAIHLKKMPLTHHYLATLFSKTVLLTPAYKRDFLTDINRTMEHSFAVSAILQNAMNLGLPLALPFIPRSKECFWFSLSQAYQRYGISHQAPNTSLCIHQ